LIGPLSALALGFATVSDEDGPVAPFIEISDREYELIHMVGDRRFEATLYSARSIPSNEGRWGWAVRETDSGGDIIRQIKNMGTDVSLQEAKVEALWSLEVLIDPDAAWNAIEASWKFMSMLGEAPFEWHRDRTLMRTGDLLLPVGCIRISPFVHGTPVASSSFAIYSEVLPVAPGGFTAFGEEDARRLLLVFAYRYLVHNS